MSNKKENIDDFVKKVVEHYDVQYDESHWEMLEDRLDEEMPLTGVGTSGLPVTSIVISIISGMLLMLGILWVSGTFEKQDATGQSVATVDSMREAKGNVSAQPDLSDVSKPAAINEEQKATGDPIIKDKTNPPVISSPSLTTQEINSDQKEKVTSLFRETELNKHDDEVLMSEMVPDLNSKSILTWSLPEYSTREMASGEIGLASTTIPEELKENIFKWGVAVSFAPDFNSVGMEASRQVSKQLGLQLFATYKDRLTISSGVLYNKKKYTTAGETYHPPSGYWIRQTNGIIPDEVFGHCAVIDVPLNLTFNWRPNHRLQLLTGLGISNYFVLSEDYSYRFDGGNPGAATGWYTEEMTKVLFGVGNVSVGLRYVIRPQVAIEIEPYLKVPFKNIGWGQVNLYSTGTLISVQYSIN